MSMFSIIIPHYNSVDKLCRLLDSIPVSEDIEIIVIDDRSDFNFCDLNVILQKSLIGKKNQVLLNKSKKGAGTCRNIGIEHSRGKYLIFADADDFFVEDWLEKVKLDCKSQHDVYFYSPTSINEHDGLISNRHLYYEKLISEYISNNSIENENNLKMTYFVPWSKVIKRELVEVNNIRFDEVIASNDIMFSSKVGKCLQSMSANLETIYCVTRSSGTLTMQTNKEVLLSRLKVERRRSDYFYTNAFHFHRTNLVHLIRTYKTVINTKILFFLIGDVVSRKIDLFPGTYIEFLKNPTLLLNKLRTIRKGN